MKNFAKVSLLLAFVVCTYAQQYPNNPNDPFGRDRVQDKYKAQQPKNNNDNKDGSNPWAAYDRYKQVYDNIRHEEQGQAGYDPNHRYNSRQNPYPQHGHYANVNDKYFIDAYSNDNPSDPKNQYYQHGDHFHSQGQNQMGYPYGNINSNINAQRPSYGYGNQRHYNAYGTGNQGTNTGTGTGSKPGATSYGKPGFCPMVSEKLSGNCRKQCNSDKECPGYNICCVNNCQGTACVEPLKEDPCKTFKCPYPGQVCMNEGTHAWCACETVCPDVYEPVCGDDRKQYNNRCYMTLESCKMKRTINEMSCAVLGYSVSKQSRYYHYRSTAPSIGGAILAVLVPLMALILNKS
ncbi:uncharacterized protein [Ptychodera flava]|uniref:uncharacterized protein n=1 Tax=Ptychodera flava TaxID=63121 RepID=UPI00396A0B02